MAINVIENETVWIACGNGGERLEYNKQTHRIRVELNNDGHLNDWVTEVYETVITQQIPEILGRWLEDQLLVVQAE